MHTDKRASTDCQRALGFFCHGFSVLHDPIAWNSVLLPHSRIQAIQPFLTAFGNTDDSSSEGVPVVLNACKVKGKRYACFVRRMSLTERLKKPGALSCYLRNTGSETRLHLPRRNLDNRL